MERTSKIHCLVVVCMHLFIKVNTTEKNTTFYTANESNVDLSRLEKITLTFWNEHNIFQESIDQRPRDNRWVFYDGPPFANGRPHYGHLLTGYLKDTYARYQTMLGHRVERRVGWDCHGLPAEKAAEEVLGKSDVKDIEINVGINTFNQICRDEVKKYISSWEDYIHRQGRWANLENSYKTMTTKYMESVMWAFKQLYDKGLVYEAERVVPYSWACQTPLSNFETKLDNSYRTKRSKTITVLFELLKKPSRLENLEPPLKMLVWTTTPWTLPGNLAIAVGRDVNYTVVWIQPTYGRKKPHVLYMFATNYMDKFEELCTTKAIEYQKLGMDFTYEDLIDLPYKPLFPYFKKTRNSFKVLVGDHVTAEEGTGIVHIAPGFGEDDFHLCKSHDIPIVCPIDSAGKFTPEVRKFAGTFVLNATNVIIEYLKAKKTWFHTEMYSHSYPHCWRTDTPLIYRAMPSWYVAVTKLKKRMAELNQKVNWIPDYVKDGIFGNWIKGAQDWSVTRNRFWGTPIPVWKSTNPKYPRIDVYGSIEELERDFGRKVTDLHRPFLDTLTRPNPDDPSGKSNMTRVTDIFDCWFDSGSMPFAQFHYPFENKDTFEENFPANFVTEYIAQTRGWFYTTFILSTALFDREPFKNCICHGVVLDARGQKLSKRLNNYVDPAVHITEYGSDALRFLMLSRPVVFGDNLLLDKHGKSIEEVLRVVVKPVWNSYSFFTLYANADGIRANVSSDPNLYFNTIDKYILLKCFQAVHEIRRNMDKFDSQEACKAVNSFFEVLNNWYIRRNRDRFWRSGHDQDKYDCYNALYTVLNYILRASAPLLPFITDTVWRNLKFSGPSVHLTSFPSVDVNFDHTIIDKMDFTRGICASVMSLRVLQKVRVRQPLKSVKVFHPQGNKLLDEEFTKIIKDETNVKEIILESSSIQFTEHHLQLKYPMIGKRIPDKVKRITELVSEKKWKKIQGGQVLVGDDTEGYLINPDEYEIKLKPKIGSVGLFDDGNGAVQLDTELDEELLLEGYARDVIRYIQETRKQADLHISDKIRVLVGTHNQKIVEAVNKWMDYIKEQTLAFSLDTADRISKDMFNRQYDDVQIALRIYHEIT